MFADPSQCGEASEIVNAFQTSRAVWELVEVLMTLILTGSKRSQKNPHRVNYVRGSFASKHLPYSLAFLLLGTDLSPLALDHEFLGTAEK